MQTRHDFDFKYNPDSDDTLVRFPSLALICGTPVLVQIGQKTLTRLSERCFRGREIHKAGNLICVSNIVQFMSMFNHTLDDLINDMYVKHPDETYFNAGLEIVCDEPIGWSSTDDIVAYSEDDLENYRPNNHTSVKRVRLNASRLAPLTNVITLVCGFFRATNDEGLPCLKVTIFSMYPGEDVGELDGDMTEREGTVMFDWNHPGEPLPGKPLPVEPRSLAA